MDLASVGYRGEVPSRTSKAIVEMASKTLEEFLNRSKPRNRDSGTDKSITE